MLLLFLGDVQSDADAITTKPNTRTMSQNAIISRFLYLANLATGHQLIFIFHKNQIQVLGLVTTCYVIPKSSRK
jgi:hypothetical protein